MSMCAKELALDHLGGLPWGTAHGRAGQSNVILWKKMINLSHPFFIQRGGGWRGGGAHSKRRGPDKWLNDAYV